jgi:hypothetical protein
LDQLVKKCPLIRKINGKIHLVSVTATFRFCT